MRTIVQEYGPIYGEPVNGTVMGRPNGSVYVPLSNTIVIYGDPDYFYCVYYPVGDKNRLLICNSSGNRPGQEPAVFYTAESQDLSSYVEYQIFSDAELTTLVTSRDFAAGAFNAVARILSYDTPSGLTDGQTLYLRAQLMNNGVPVATSNVIELTMVVPA